MAIIRVSGGGRGGLGHGLPFLIKSLYPLKAYTFNGIILLYHMLSSNFIQTPLPTKLSM